MTYPFPSTTSSFASCLQLLQVPVKNVSLDDLEISTLRPGNATHHFVECGSVVRGVVLAQRTCNVQNRALECGVVDLAR